MVILLFTCSSPCTTQLIQSWIELFSKIIQKLSKWAATSLSEVPLSSLSHFGIWNHPIGSTCFWKGKLANVSHHAGGRQEGNKLLRAPPRFATKQHSSVVMNFQKTQENETQLSTSFSSSSKIAIKALRAGTCNHTALTYSCTRHGKPSKTVFGDKLGGNPCENLLPMLDI